MNEERHKQLESWADRQLRSLPRPVAPPELISRVHRALAARQQHGVSVPQPHAYPLKWRLLAMALCVGSVLLCMGFAFNVPAAEWQSHGMKVSGLWTQLTDIWQGLLTLLNAVTLVFRNVGQSAVLIAFLLFSALAAVCAGIGTLCFRVVTIQKEI